MDTTNKFFLPISVIAAGLLIAGAVVWNGKQAPATPTTKGGFGNAASIDKLNASIAGLDAAKIAEDVKANTAAYQAVINTNIDVATRLSTEAGQQYPSTPASLVGNKYVLGAFPYEALKLAIENPTGPINTALQSYIEKSKATANIKALKTTSADIATQQAPFIGKADAPLTLIFISDFQCPFCKEFEAGGQSELEARGMTATMPDILTNYVQTGKVKIVFMDVAFLGKDSTTAALYDQAVWKLYPDKYFEWRTAMFKAQDGENDSSAS